MSFVFQNFISVQYCCLLELLCKYPENTTLISIHIIQKSSFFNQTFNLDKIDKIPSPFTTPFYKAIAGEGAPFTTNFTLLKPILPDTHFQT